MGRIKVTVAIVAVLILAGGIVAPNMGFRIVHALKAADGGVTSLSGVNTLGLPYTRKPGLATVANLWDDLIDQGVDVLEIRRHDPVTDQMIVYTDGGADFPLEPGIGYMVQVGSNTDYVLMGSHSPGTVLNLQGPGPGSLSGTNFIVMPYHSKAKTASDLFKEIGSPPVQNIQRYFPSVDLYGAYSAGSFDFPLLPGEAYRVTVSSSIEYVPAHK